MELENRVTELKILRGAWSNEQLSLERKVNTTYPNRIQQYQRQIEQIRQDVTLLEQSKGGDFSIMLDGKRYTERPEAGEALALLYRRISEGRKRMTTILRSAPTVDFGSILALIHSQRGLFYGEAPGTTQTLVLLVRSNHPH